MLKVVVKVAVVVLVVVVVTVVCKQLTIEGKNSMPASFLMSPLDLQLNVLRFSSSVM